RGRGGARAGPAPRGRDRPAVDRGDGVYLVGDQVAAPGVLSEVSFTSAVEAVSLALRSDRGVLRKGLDLKHA
ncbi:FAD-dependent oxidoreductase, partial [Streptomyces sp. NPDC059556]